MTDPESETTTSEEDEQSASDEMIVRKYAATDNVTQIIQAVDGGFQYAADKIMRDGVNAYRASFSRMRFHDVANLSGYAGDSGYAELVAELQPILDSFEGSPLHRGPNGGLYLSNGVRVRPKDVWLAEDVMRAGAGGPNHTESCLSNLADEGVSAEELLRYARENDLYDIGNRIADVINAQRRDAANPGADIDNPAGEVTGPDDLGHIEPVADGTEYQRLELLQPPSDPLSREYLEWLNAVFVDNGQLPPEVVANLDYDLILQIAGLAGKMGYWGLAQALHDVLEARNNSGSTTTTTTGTVDDDDSD